MSEEITTTPLRPTTRRSGLRPRLSRSLGAATAGLAGIAVLTGGVAAVAAGPASASAPNSTISVRCHGTTTACTAKVSLAGGASNEHVVVQLPGSGMHLTSAKPNSRNLDGAYMLTGQRLRHGGNQYAFTLNAAEAPHGSTLTLTFRKPSAPGTTTIPAHGNSSSAKARIPIAGGASNRRIVVQLPATDLGLVSVKPSSPDLRGAYSLSHQHLRAAGSEYVFRLNAVQAAPKGAHLTLTFAA